MKLFEYWKENPPQHLLIKMYLEAKGATFGGSSDGPQDANVASPAAAAILGGFQGQSIANEPDYRKKAIEEALARARKPN